MDILSITHCTASKSYMSEFKVSDVSPHQSFEEFFICWSDFLKNTKSMYQAKDLYTGGGFKKLSKRLSQKEFLIISAGLGLVNSKKMIPSYECTVSRGKLNSISDYFKDQFIYDQWWNYLISSKYSLGFINENTKKSDIILISVTADYLKMIAQDLKLLNKKFYIFTGSKDLATSLGFKKNLMPYTEVFDGPDGTLRGTNRDFPQRTHTDFLRRIKQFGSFELAFKSVEDDMKKWVPPTKHKNARKTNEEIVNLIQHHEDKFNKVSDLLRYFRYELKVSCEERRFKSLYKLFKEQHACPMI
jgi:hypothetical protein